jgi:hypothetical protein
MVKTKTYKIVLKTVNPDKKITTISAIKEVLPSLSLGDTFDAFNKCRRTGLPQTLQSGLTEDEVLKFVEEIQTNLKNKGLDSTSVYLENE